VRLHRRIARLHIRGQLGGDRRRFSAGFAPALQCDANGVGMRHAAVERLADGDLQFGGTVAVEQPEQAHGDGAQISLTKSHSRKLTGDVTFALDRRIQG
jgi:hypothetical protein